VASTSTAAPGAPSSASAAGTESSPRAPLYKGEEWIWPGYIPLPGLTVILGSFKAATTLVAIKVAATVSAGGAWPGYSYAAVGEVIWLTAQHGSTTTMALRDQLIAAGAEIDPLAGIDSVHIVEPESDDCGLPIHHLCRDLQRLESKLTDANKVSVAVIDYFSPYVGEDAEQALHDFRGALRALKDLATTFRVAVILPCRLPCHGGSSVIPKVIDALSGAREVDSVLAVEGTNGGTVVPKKTWAGVDANPVAFRTSRKPGLFDSASVIVWEISIAKKSAVKHEPFTTGSVASREIPNTSNPDVSDETSNPGVVPPQSDETPAAPSEPSPPPGVAPADSIDGAAATRGTTPQSLRAGATADVGKPVVRVAKPRGWTVAVPPLIPKRVPGTPAPVISAAAEDGDKKGRGLAKSAFGAKQSVGLRQGVPTRPSTKVPKLEKRKLRSRKKAIGSNKTRFDPSDWS
jgi:hypothetical protein